MTAMSRLLTPILLSVLFFTPPAAVFADMTDSAKDAAEIAIRLKGKSDQELWKDMQAIAVEKAEKKGWTLLEDAGEKALGTRIKKSDGETLLKTIEAASAGDWEAAAREGGPAIIGAYVPLLGQYISALTKANEALQAGIRDWMDDLYGLQSYLWLERRVEDLYEQGGRINGFVDDGDPYLPSYRLKEGSEEQQRMRETEAQLFARWVGATTHDVNELQTRYGSRIRQVLGRMPTDREIFNHFYHRITRQNLARYQKTYTMIRSDQLAARTEKAKRGLVQAFRGQVEALTAAAPADKEGLTVRGYLNDYGGAPIEAPVANGAILAFDTEASYPPAAIPPVTTLSWQVMDAAGNAIAGLGKREQIAEAGVTKVHRFKFRPDGLRNGAYRVVLTRRASDDMGSVVEGSTGFSIFQSLSITRVVVTTDSEATRHTETIRPEQTPMLFAYYIAVEGTREINAELSVRDAETGVEYARQSVERPVKPNVAEQRIGLGLDPGAVPSGRKAIFVAALAAAGGPVVTREAIFSVRPYLASVRFAHFEARAGEAVDFTITPPPEFTPPLRVALSTQSRGGGKISARMISETRGTLTAGLPPGRSGAAAGLTATVTDAKGRVAEGSSMLTVRSPPPPPVAVSPVPAPSPEAWAQATDNNLLAQPPEQAQPPAPRLDLSDALATFQQQMAQIQANKQAGDRAAEQRQQQEWNAFNRQQPQTQQAARNYFALVSHAVMPGQSLSYRTANSCRVVQGRPVLSCGRSQCGASPYFGKGAELCGPGGAFSSFSRYVGPMDVHQARSYCNQVAADPKGLGSASGSSTFFCFPP